MVFKALQAEAYQEQVKRSARLWHGMSSFSRHLKVEEQKTMQLAVLKHDLCPHTAWSAFSSSAAGGGFSPSRAEATPWLLSGY